MVRKRQSSGDYYGGNTLICLSPQQRAENLRISVENINKHRAKAQEEFDEQNRVLSHDELKARDEQFERERRERNIRIAAKKYKSKQRKLKRVTFS